MKHKLFSVFIAATLLLSSCQTNPVSSTSEGLKVVASTTILGDVVKQVGGDRISLTVLLPIGADPHSFEPRPQDAAAISEARIVFLNGLELEHSMESTVEANASGLIVEVSNGIEPLPFNENHTESDQAVEHAAGDPHVWMDPLLVKVWVENIRAALCQADPINADFYTTNAEDYTNQLSELDAWIRSEVKRIPQENRKIVTDHESMAYFAKQYGFELTGLVVASLSSGASPSAKELADLENTIRDQQVPAIFVDTTVNPALAQQVAQDTGIALIPIYNGSLGDEASGVTSYIQFMKTNVAQIVKGLE